MYNEEIKHKYLATLSEGGTRNAISIFKQIEVVEEEYSEDAIYIPKDILAKYLATKCHTLATLQNKMGIVNRYKDWANNEGIVSDDYKAFIYEKCDLSDIYHKYSGSTIFHNPLEVRETLDKYLPVRDEHGITIDELASAYMMLVFSGIKPDDVLQITTNDVIVKNKSIVVSTRDNDIAVYKEFEGLIKKLHNVRICMNLSHNDYGAKIMNDKFIDNGKNMSAKTFREILNKRLYSSMTPLHYNITDVYLMGIIFKRRVETNNNIDRRELLVECYGEDWTKKNRVRLYELLKQW